MRAHAYSRIFILKGFYFSNVEATYTKENGNMQSKRTGIILGMFLMFLWNEHSHFDNILLSASFDLDCFQQAMKNWLPTMFATVLSAFQMNKLGNMFFSLCYHHCCQLSKMLAANIANNVIRIYSRTPLIRSSSDCGLNA